MIEFKFSIHGNHENKNGNPLPKHRKTHRQQWTPEARRYHAYLDYVRAEFLSALQRSGKINSRQFRDFFYVLGPKPLHTGKRKCRMEIFITWGSNAHGDPENIFGAVADAIFEQDKFLAGTFDFDPIARSAGRVDVRIEIGDEPGEPPRSRVHSRPRVKVAK